MPEDIKWNLLWPDKGKSTIGPHNQAYSCWIRPLSPLTSLQYGGQEISLDSARELHRRAGISEPLEDIFALTDLDKNGRLNYPEFLLFMYLLKLLRKGVALPKHLSYERVSLLCLASVTCCQLPLLLQLQLQLAVPFQQSEGTIRF